MGKQEKRQYAEYLVSEHWKKLRAAKIAESGRICFYCKSTYHIQVHHMRYRSSWEDAELEDLVVVCEDCHRKIHAGKIKTTPSKKKKAKKRKTVAKICFSVEKRYHSKAYFNRLARSR